MLLSVLFIFFCATLLIPFIVFAMYLIHMGDIECERDRAAFVQSEAQLATQLELEGTAGARYLAIIEASTPPHSSPQRHPRPARTA